MVVASVCARGLPQERQSSRRCLAVTKPGRPEPVRAPGIDSARATQGATMPLILWLLGVPLSLVLILWLTGIVGF